MKKIVVFLSLFAIVFGVYHIINNRNENVNYGDKIEFSEKTIPGEKLVFYDNQVNFKNYYVIKFTDSGNYIKHGYYYLNNKTQYLNLYQGLYDMVVDYNYDKFLIRTVEDSGIATYDEFYKRYEKLFNDKVYVVIE